MGQRLWPNIYHFELKTDISYITHIGEQLGTYCALDKIDRINTGQHGIKMHSLTMVTTGNSVGLWQLQLVFNHLPVTVKIVGYADKYTFSKMPL